VNLNPTLSLARKLAASVAKRTALITAGASLTDLDVMRLDKESRIYAADLEAAFAEPQSYSAWTDWNHRNACPEYKPGSAT